MKKFFGYMGKCGIAAVISVIILSLFSMIYYNPPVATEQPDGTTNFKYQPDSDWTFMLEGHGYGKTDNLGYNNAYYDNLTDPDVIFIGSSHMEALQVSQDANCVFLLNEKLACDDSADNDLKCLNLGMSGHFFEVTASNFGYIAERYNGTKYAVIEVFNVNYSPAMLDDIVTEKFRAPIEEKGALYETAQKVPYLRLLYKKINETASETEAPAAEEVTEDASDSESVYAEKMNEVLAKIAKLSAENDIKPIILLHERFWKDNEGNIVTEMDENYKNIFKKCCETNGIDVIDATPEMIANYKENFEFSYGFSNSAPGEGHLNETGHRIIAETVYKYINEKEGKK